MDWSEVFRDVPRMTTPFEEVPLVLGSSPTPPLMRSCIHSGGAVSTSPKLGLSWSKCLWWALFMTGRGVGLATLGLLLTMWYVLHRVLVWGLDLCKKMSGPAAALLFAVTIPFSDAKMQNRHKKRHSEYAVSEISEKNPLEKIFLETFQLNVLEMYSKNVEKIQRASKSPKLTLNLAKMVKKAKMLLLKPKIGPKDHLWPRLLPKRGYQIVPPSNWSTWPLLGSCETKKGQSWTCGSKKS